MAGAKEIVNQWIARLPVNQIPSTRYLEQLTTAIEVALGARPPNRASVLIEGVIGLLDGLAAYDELARPSVFLKQVEDLWRPLAERYLDGRE